MKLTAPLQLVLTPDPDNATQLVARTITSAEAMRLPRKRFDALQEYITRHPYNTWEKLLVYYRRKKGLGKNNSLWNDPDEPGGRNPRKNPTFFFLIVAIIMLNVFVINPEKARWLSGLFLG